MQPALMEGVLLSVTAQVSYIPYMQVHHTHTHTHTQPPPHTHSTPPHTHSIPPTEIVENDDVIEVGGQVFHKPFVEKPVSAEDHNIYIYFPSDYGGGSQRLFRKVSTSCSSSQFSIILV